jgi:adenylyltransferase/sulfurtransferase
LYLNGSGKWARNARKTHALVMPQADAQQNGLENAAAQGLAPEENLRYARHLSLADFGTAGQLRLKQSRVLVVGAGGLGSPALLYLAAAGIGRIGIVDGDRIERHNLQRQVLYADAEVGQSKAERAASRIRALNPNVEVETMPYMLDAENAEVLIAPWDIVLDGSDNFPTRYAVNDACAALNKPHVHASIERYTGQLTALNVALPDGSRGPDYRDLYPEPPAPGTVPDCSEGGVLGVLPGILGTWQAAEAIKILSGLGEPLVGRLLLMDLRSGQVHTMRYSRDPERSRAAGKRDVLEENTHAAEARTAPVESAVEAAAPSPLKSYGKSATAAVMEPDSNGHRLSEAGPSGANGQAPVPLKRISVQAFKALRESGEPYQLIDVREPYEYEIAQIGGQLMPVAKVVDAEDRIRKDCKVIVHCHAGKRSANVIRVLEARFGLSNLYNLEGGIRAWSQEIDPSVPDY